MGVDAEMCVQTPDLLTDREIMKLSFDAAEAFGRSQFYIDRETRQSAITRWEPEEWTSIEGEGPFIKPNIWTRYYGIDGYERGDIVFLIALAEWLEHRLPGCKVFYGSDTDDIYEEWGADRRKAWFAHFAEVGHKPYTGYFQRDVIAPVCDWCEEPLRATTWQGGGVIRFECTHCGHEVHRNPAGVA